jgi:hypothetical protein
MSAQVHCQYNTSSSTNNDEKVWAGEAPYTPIDRSSAPASHGGEALPKLEGRNDEVRIPADVEEDDDLEASDSETADLGV